MNELTFKKLDTLIIMACFGLSFLGCLIGGIAIWGYHNMFWGGEFDWIIYGTFFFYGGLLACGIHFLSIFLAITHFKREHFKIQKLHKLCIIGFVLSAIYLIYYGILWIDYI